MKTFAVLVTMSALLMAAQCNVKPSPAPTPAPSPAPPPAPPTITVDAAAPTPPPAPSNDKCQAVLTLVLSEGCTLPNEWLDTCRAVRLHGGTFHLKCFAGATDCDQVAACLNAPG